MTRCYTAVPGRVFVGKFFIIIGPAPPIMCKRQRAMDCLLPFEVSASGIKGSRKHRHSITTYSSVYM